MFELNLIFPNRYGDLMAYLYIDLQFWFCVTTRDEVAANSVGREQGCRREKAPFQKFNQNEVKLSNSNEENLSEDL